MNISLDDDEKNVYLYVFLGHQGILKMIFRWCVSAETEWECWRSGLS